MSIPLYGFLEGDTLGLLMLAEETPENRAESRCQTGTHARVDVVLVVPQLVGELLALHRQRDRDDHIGKSPAELITSLVALVAQTEVRMGLPPADSADSADTTAGREDRYEVVTVRLTELGNRCHGLSGPHEFCRLRRLGRQPLQSVEDMLSIVHDGDAGTLGVAAGPVVLQQAAHEEHMAPMLQRGILRRIRAIDTGADNGNSAAT